MSLKMIFRHKKFSPLMWTQFFGALNDNLFKNALVVMLAFRSIEMWGLKSESLVSFATLIFILPFFILSAHAGKVADKLEKSQLIRIIKIAEIFIMALAGIGFHFQVYSLLFVSLFLMGVHSTFFGPVKYSILPELVDESNLTAGNAYVELGTFIAILIGTIAGGYLASLHQGEIYIIFSLILLSCIGLFFGKKVPAVSIANPDLKIQWNPIPQTLSTVKIATQPKAVFNSILGISWFWFLGAVILSLLPIITKNILNGDGPLVTLFLASFTIGIALGAIICEKLSFERVEIGLVPFGSLGMTLFLADLALVIGQWKTPLEATTLHSFLQTENSYRLLGDLFLIAVFGGVFTVPLYTVIQQRSEVKNRSQVIGANNIINSLFMVVGSALLMVFLEKQVSISSILFFYSALNLAVAIYIYFIVPEFTLRFFCWILAHLLYRVKVKGIKNIPSSGAALLVCNHVSFIDWMLIFASIQRPVKFVMYYKFAGIPLIKYLMKHAGVIPIAGHTEDSEIFNNAFKRISQDLKRGDLICIFPEGSITEDGQLHSFKRGIEHALAIDPVPVVPLALKGLWGSIFSHKGSPAFTKIWPEKIWPLVKLSIGEAVPPEQAQAAYLEEKVRELLAVT